MLQATVAVLVLLLQQGQAEVKVLRFTGPEKAKAEDLAKAAKALEGRIRDFGYEGITAKVKKEKKGSVIEVVAAAPLTAQMQDRIAWLAVAPCTSVEVVYRISASAAEIDQFGYPPAGANLSKQKAPPGKAWFQRWSFEDNGRAEPGSGVVDTMVANSRFPVSELSWRMIQGERAPNLEIRLNEAGAKRLASLGTIGNAVDVLVLVDGRYELTNQVWLKEVDGVKVFLAEMGAPEYGARQRVCIANPLPFELSAQ